MKTKEGYTKIINFMTLGAGVLVLECGHISHIVKIHYFLAVDIQILALLTISQCKVSDTRVTVKA